MNTQQAWAKLGDLTLDERAAINQMAKKFPGGIVALMSAFDPAEIKAKAQTPVPQGRGTSREADTSGHPALRKNDLKVNERRDGSKRVVWSTRWGNR